jgi:EAL domain-containing protein (putative c-di-GMP-specific phosphodiesterase class I)
VTTVHGGAIRTWVEPDWAAALSRVLAHPEQVRLLFQPIVDLERGEIAGYEALARFDEPEGALSPHSPDVWFAAADRLGVGAELEGIVVQRLLAMRHDRPPQTFLSVNVSPQHLMRPELVQPLLAEPDLVPLVFELSDHGVAHDATGLAGTVEQLRDRGARFALTDAGSGYAGLQELARFRPDAVKLDRALTSGIEGDEVKRGLTGVLGRLAERHGFWLMAEGVETWDALEAIVRLGVPLAQGWLLGYPAGPFATIDESATFELRRRWASTHFLT